ncbi:MAG: endonuclease III [Candidatus Hydrogenedentota bacterium]
MAKVETSLSVNKARAIEIYKRLAATYPDAHCTLNFESPFQLLAGTILAAQCTDERVNKTTMHLFKKYRMPQDYLDVPQEELEQDIRPCGFYRNKAKNLRAMCATLLEEFNGQVPGTMDELLQLGGVGRKTANVVLGECFGGQGVIVDTHCTRVASRLGFTKETDAVKIERDLQKVWPADHWTLFSHYMVFHGRSICTARAPICSRCPLNDVCPFPNTTEGKNIAR